MEDSCIFSYKGWEVNCFLAHFVIELLDVVLVVIGGLDKGILEKHFDLHQVVFQNCNVTQEFSFEFIDLKTLIRKVVKLMQLVLLLAEELIDQGNASLLSIQFGVVKGLGAVLDVSLLFLVDVLDIVLVLLSVLIDVLLEDIPAVVVFLQNLKLLGIFTLFLDFLNEFVGGINLGIYQFLIDCLHIIFLVNGITCVFAGLISVFLLGIISLISSYRFIV